GPYGPDHGRSRRAFGMLGNTGAVAGGELVSQGAPSSGVASGGGPTRRPVGPGLRATERESASGGHGPDHGCPHGTAVAHPWPGPTGRDREGIIAAMSEHFDVVVLGAGPGGYTAAVRAAQLGYDTAVIEERYWGGVCLNAGCIPSKALLRNAELAHLSTREARTFGIHGDGEVTFDYGAAYQRSRKVADGRVKGIHYLMKKNAITEFHGRGTFTSDSSIDVATADGVERVTFDHCIIAAGASPRLLPGTSISDRVVTYEQQILSSELPESIVICGAGAIGVEFAYILHNYGVKVTIVEFMDRMVPAEDEE